MGRALLLFEFVLHCHLGTWVESTILLCNAGTQLLSLSLGFANCIVLCDLVIEEELQGLICNGDVKVSLSNVHPIFLFNSIHFILLKLLW